MSGKSDFMECPTNGSSCRASPQLRSRRYRCQPGCKSCGLWRDRAASSTRPRHSACVSLPVPLPAASCRSIRPIMSSISVAAMRLRPSSGVSSALSVRSHSSMRLDSLRSSASSFAAAAFADGGVMLPAFGWEVGVLVVRSTVFAGTSTIAARASAAAIPATSHGRRGVRACTRRSAGSRRRMSDDVACRLRGVVIGGTVIVAHETVRAQACCRASSSHRRAASRAADRAGRASARRRSGRLWMGDETWLGLRSAVQETAQTGRAARYLGFGEADALAECVRDLRV